MAQADWDITKDGGAFTTFAVAGAVGSKYLHVLNGIDLGLVWSAFETNDPTFAGGVSDSIIYVNASFNTTSPPGFFSNYLKLCLRSADVGVPAQRGYEVEFSYNTNQTDFDIDIKKNDSSVATASVSAPTIGSSFDMRFLVQDVSGDAVLTAQYDIGSNWATLATYTDPSAGAIASGSGGFVLGGNGSEGDWQLGNVIMDEIT